MLFNTLSGHFLSTNEKQILKSVLRAFKINISYYNLRYIDFAKMGQGVLRPPPKHTFPDLLFFTCLNSYQNSKKYGMTGEIKPLNLKLIEIFISKISHQLASFCRTHPKYLKSFERFIQYRDIKGKYLVRLPSVIL